MAKKPGVVGSSCRDDRTPQYGDDALRWIDRYFKADHAVIIPLTVKGILDEQIARKLA